MKITLLLCCAAGALLLLVLPHQPHAAPGPIPPSAALLETMNSHGIEVGAAVEPDLQPVAYAINNPR